MKIRLINRSTERDANGSRGYRIYARTAWLMSYNCGWAGVYDKCRVQCFKCFSLDVAATALKIAHNQSGLLAQRYEYAEASVPCDCVGWVGVWEFERIVSECDATGIWYDWCIKPHRELCLWLNPCAGFRDDLDDLHCVVVILAPDRVVAARGAQQDEQTGCKPYCKAQCIVLDQSLLYLVAPRLIIKRHSRARGISGYSFVVNLISKLDSLPALSLTPMSSRMYSVPYRNLSPFDG